MRELCQMQQHGHPQHQLGPRSPLAPTLTCTAAACLQLPPRDWRFWIWLHGGGLIGFELGGGGLAGGSDRGSGMPLRQHRRYAIAQRCQHVVHNPQPRPPTPPARCYYRRPRSGGSGGCRWRPPEQNPKQLDRRESARRTAEQPPRALQREMPTAPAARRSPVGGGAGRRAPLRTMAHHTRRASASSEGGSAG